MIRRPVLVALVVLTACISARNAEPECTGPMRVTIRNNWSQPVDVYAHLRNSSGFILGEVAPGERRQFDLPEGARGVYYDWRKAPITRPTSSDILTTYDCR